MKKFLSILLAAMMVLATAGVAFAATVTVANDDLIKDNTFVGYQIFAGTQEANSNTLSSVTWGSGIDSTAFLAALKADATLGTTFANCTTAAQVAEAMKSMQDNSEAAKKIAKIAYDNKTGDGQAIKSGDTYTDFAAGYYLFVDTTNTDGQDKVKNAALLQLTGKGNFEITVKTDKPSVVKKVKEIGYTDSTKYGTDGFNDVADYSIGDIITFRFYAPIPDLTYFDNYTFTFHDTMSAGLTLNSVSSVKIGTTELSYDATYNGCDITGHTFHVQVKLKENGQLVNAAVAKDAELIVEYTAKLNEDAVIDLEGNPNEVYLEYSNNPNGDGTGNTAPDKVIVFTYDINVQKMDISGETPAPLAGAKFVLYKNTDNGAVFAEMELDTDGYYIVKNWVALSAEQKAKDTNSDLKDDATGDWLVPSGATEVTTPADGFIKVKGLEDGNYYVIETATKDASYNMPTEDFDVELSATTINNQDWAGVNANTALTATNCSVDNPVVINNTKGATLPETGGIGTTLFYLIGGLMAAGSALTLVIRRRADADEE